MLSGYYGRNFVFGKLMVSNSVANSHWGNILSILYVWKNGWSLKLQHAENANYDTQRDDWLRDQGFVVLRFWNHDVLKNITDVTERIFQTLQSTPYLNPSPQGGRRKTRNR
jgi:hypothetical protein